MTNLIVTITDYSNYGNRLQNYALQTLLSQYEDATTAYMELGISNEIKKLISKGRRLARPLKEIISSKDQKLQIARAKRFRDFSTKFIKDKDFRLTQQSGLTPKAADNYSRVIIGSDQVWNPQWLTNEELALRLGSFARDDHSIISYAASFGTSTVRESSLPIFRQYLPRLKAISVREFQGSELIKKITGLDSTVVLDPTLMINAKEWKKITDNFITEDERYILTYFLGHPTDAQEQSIQEYAKRHNCHIRRILDPRDRKTYLAGPQDFVELFSKASYVFTDSYHACCFSILFKKQFTVFNRSGKSGKENMNSRMETLFDLFNLKSTVLTSGTAPKINYSEVDQLLTRHRLDSRQWLESAMSL